MSSDAEQSAGTPREASDRGIAERTGAASVLSTVAFFGSAAVLVVAVVAATWFGVGWVHAALSDGPRADEREAAVAGARQFVLNTTTMNLDDVPGSLALAKSSMTGALLDSLDEYADQPEQWAQQKGLESSSTVRSAALTSLNSELDRASALVVFQLTETGKDRPPIESLLTWSIDMTKVDGVWKAEQVYQHGEQVLLSEGPARQPIVPQADQPPAPAADQPQAPPKPGS
ncbi:hypothetical protein ACL02S_19980 [Nocardia sp. 004]|uniref:hypothetical protein n=1 Tax=Nocardia sp. 004 TaxID=3385978 RepID=UPI0039A26364